MSGLSTKAFWKQGALSFLRRQKPYPMVSPGSSVPSSSGFLGYWLPGPWKGFPFQAIKVQETTLAPVTHSPPVLAIDG